MTDEDERTDYRMSPARRALIQARDTGGRLGAWIERIRDAGIYAVYAVGIPVAVGIAGSGWFPITGGGLDFWLWIGICVGVSALVALLLRRARRQRYGDASSHLIAGPRDAVAYLLGFWCGMLALIGLLRQLVSPEPVEAGWILAFLALGCLGATAYAAFSYVIDPPADDDL